MILTCPNCNSQFNLDDDLLGKDGRKVKCSSCENVWFQESEPLQNDTDVSDDVDELEGIVSDVDDTDIEIEADVEESDAEDSDVSVPTDGNLDEQDSDRLRDSIFKSIMASSDKNSTASIGIVLSVFFISLIYLMSNSASIMKAYPSMQYFYGMFYIEMDIPGKGLTFDKIVAEDNAEMIKVSGHIINLESKDKVVPIIEASLLDEDHGVITQWYISPPEDILHAEERLAFDSIYYRQDSHMQDASHGEHEEDAAKAQHLSLQLRFIMMSKTDAEGDENNPVPHQDDSDHQSDHAASSESHQSASSAHHQEPSHQNHAPSHQDSPVHDMDDQEGHNAGHH